MQRKIIVPLIAIMLLAAGLLAAANQQPKIAVVNIAKVFEQSNNRDTGEKELQAQMDRAMETIEKYKAEAQKLQTALDKLEKGSPKYIELSKQRVELMASAEIYSEQTKIKIQNRENAIRQELYANIRETIDKYAKQQGYELVLKIDDNYISGKSVVTQDIQMSTRVVLYNSQKMDITAEIVKAINKK